MSIIKSIEIKSFKSILEQKIELGRLNVFIGCNGAGKSNLLEAIAMLSASIDGGIDYEKLNRRGARLSSPEVFKSAFKNVRRRPVFNVEAEFETCTYSMAISPSDGFSYHSECLKNKDRKKTRLAGRGPNGMTLDGISLRVRPMDKDVKIDKDKSIISLFQLLHGDFKGLDSIKKFAIYAPSTPILRGSTSDSSSKEPLGLYGGRLGEALKEVIAQFREGGYKGSHDIYRFFRILDWVKTIATTDQVNHSLLSDHVSLMGKNIVQFTDKYMSKNFNNLYAYDVSEGVLYILFVLVLLIHKSSPNMFAIDNIDSALNPGLVRVLMSNICEIIKAEKNKQVFITTHNPTALDSLDLFDEDIRLFVVERKGDGVTNIRRVSPPSGMTKEQWESQYSHLKLSEIWSSGAIGGLPEGVV